MFLRWTGVRSRKKYEWALVRLGFYRTLNLELPVLAGGREMAATVVFDLFANLFASVLLYIALDRVFNKGID